ncbi:MAG: DNA polymerase III subunit beta [Candidatus Gygaella obscura]|nr:DNA polymerase III subunit beta [Candidatus Gygaella obscura]
MKIKTNKKELLNQLQVVQNIISPKATLPILSNILIETKNNDLRFTSTDLDIGITCLLPVDINEQGAITLPARRFIEIIRELPDNEIRITTRKNNTTLIETDNCQFKLSGLPKEEFPKLPELKDKQVFKIEQAELKQMINLTSFAVSHDESRFVLSGILFNIKNNKITTVATDGRRLAVYTKSTETNIAKEINSVVPLKAIMEINKNLTDEGDVSIVFGSNQALFEFKNKTIVTRLIEGEFPDYNQVIPRENDGKIKIDREEFLSALKRAALLNTPDFQAVKLTLSKNKLVVSKTTPDVGESWEELKTITASKDLIIGFNPVYLVDVLKNLTDVEVEIELTEPEKPAVIRSNGYVYVVLPMRLT